MRFKLFRYDPVEYLVIGFVSFTLTFYLMFLFTVVGLNYTIATGDSMQPTYSSCEVQFIDERAEPEVGDVVHVEYDYQEDVSHRLVSINQDIVITKGDANKYTEQAYKKDIVGVVIASYTLPEKACNVVNNGYFN